MIILGRLRMRVVMQGLTWEPKMVPTYQKRESLVGVNFDGSISTETEFVEVPNARLMERDDTHEVIGHGISDRYTPISNAEMFGVLEVLVQEGLKIETAGSIRGGAQGVGVGVFGSAVYVAG